ncbi:hypothetical protein V6N11_033271 [Hibiscus sabdariffa]|uniref:RNase H type-1 domain-containing protein n=1 Tax=Hibiscus sabdariffa TaxID=183260 RepID=A0ABR2PY47_9ROSI
MLLLGNGVPHNEQSAPIGTTCIQAPTPLTAIPISVGKVLSSSPPLAATPLAANNLVFVADPMEDAEEGIVHGGTAAVDVVVEPQVQVPAKRSSGGADHSKVKRARSSTPTSKKITPKSTQMGLSTSPCMLREYESLHVIIWDWFLVTLRSILPTAWMLYMWIFLRVVGLQLAQDKGWSRIHIESDSAIIINKFNRTGPNLSVMGSQVANARDLL